jgi:hypothetical protein
MLFGNENLFSLVRSAKLGGVELSPVLAELRDWIQRELGVRIVYIVFDHIDIGPCTGRPRLNIILETDLDYDSWKTDVVTIRPDVERRVLSRFAKLAQADAKTFDTDDVLLILDNFSDECLGRACAAFLKSDAGLVIRDFAVIPIWKIDGFSRYLVVFLTKEQDIRLKTDDGTCDRISKRCFDAVKQYDEFDYLSAGTFRLKFDSKENLDKNFNGSLFYYWR